VKRLSLTLTPAGTVSLPARLNPVRISLVAILATSAAATDSLLCTLRDGAGAIAGQWIAPGVNGGTQEAQGFAVNSPDGVIVGLAIVESRRFGFIPPDLIVGFEDTLTFSFVTAPTSVDSSLIVSYEELKG